MPGGARRAVSSGGFVAEGVFVSALQRIGANPRTSTVRDEPSLGWPAPPRTNDSALLPPPVGLLLFCTPIGRPFESAAPACPCRPGGSADHAAHPWHNHNPSRGLKPSGRGDCNLVDRTGVACGPGCLSPW